MTAIQHPFIFSKIQEDALHSNSTAKKKSEDSTHEIAAKIIQSLRTGYFKNKSEWRRDISAITANQLKQVLDAVMREMSCSDQPVQTMELLAEIVPLEQLQNSIRLDHTQHINALQTAKEMLQEAKYALQTTDENLSPSLRLRLSAAADSLISLIETIFAAFGIADFFKPPENAFEAEGKSQKIMMLITWSTLLISLIGTVVGSATIGWTIFSIAGLSLIYPYFRPTPFYLPKAVNLTKLLQQGQLAVSQGRKKSLDEIAHTLLASTKVKTHPLLIGRSGVGKTETVKSFVQAIERGDYPELKGKQVFYFNTADLVKSSEILQSENKILSKISEAIGRHRNNIILVFDEIHLACQTDQQVFGEQLKTMLDPGSANLPYVIGITTEEEFYRDIYKNNGAFARRFKRINIENTDSSETLAILTNTFLQQAPKLILENGALSSLLEKTKAAFSLNAPEPITSLKILSQCIQRTAESQKSILEEKVEQVRIQIQSLHAQEAAGQGNALLPYQRGQQIQHLENELRQLEQNLQREQEERNRFFQLRDRLAESKMATFKTVVKIANLKQHAVSTNNNSLTSFLLISHFLAPCLEKCVCQEASRLGIKTAIDSTLIDQVIQDELDSEKKAQAATIRGKTQIKERES